MNAIHRASFYRLLNPLRTVPVLANRSGAPQIGLDNEGIAGHMSAVSATNTDSLINPDSTFTKHTTQNGFASCQWSLSLSRSRESERGVNQDSGVPTGYDQLDSSVLQIGLFRHLKTFTLRDGKHAVQGVTLGELGKKALNRNVLFPEI